MKISTLFFASILFFCSASAWAEWRAPKDLPEMLADGRGSREFVLQGKQSKKGLMIFGMDIDRSSLVTLRYFNKVIDYSIYLTGDLNKKPIELYLNLLDEDKLLIKSVLIDRIEKEYVGDLFGSFDLSWDSFSNVKYYYLHLRS